MIRYVVVSIISGILFGTMDGLINANSIAQKLFEVYRPIAKASINLTAGIFIDLAYGFLMAAIFMLLYKSLPGNTGLVKGLCFGLLVWFFRVAMRAGSDWMMFNVPCSALIYSVVAGLIEMLILGVLYGVTLKSLP